MYKPMKKVILLLKNSMYQCLTLNRIHRTLVIFSFSVFIAMTSLCSQSPQPQIEAMDFADFLDDFADSAYDDLSHSSEITYDNIFDETDTHEKPSKLSTITSAIILHSVAAYYTCKKTLIDWNMWFYNHAQECYKYLLN